MKKLIGLFIVLIMCLVFSGCERQFLEENTDFVEINIKDYIEKNGVSTFNIGAAVIKIDSDTINQKLLVDDVLVFTTSYPFFKLDEIIYRYGDSFVVTANKKTFAYLYDSENKSMSDFSSFSKYNLVTIAYNVSKEGLTFETSAKSDEELFVDNMEKVLINSCDLYNKYKDYYVEATIEKKYLGDGKFDDYKIVKSKKVSDFPEYNTLCK